MKYACAQRMRIDHFRNLTVWQLADELRREIMAFTDTGSASKDFKYRDQIRDAIASACRNTSEGFDRFRPAEFARFLEFAKGSLGEVQDCLIDGHNRKYIDGDRFDKMWRLSKRAIGSNTRLHAYLKDCAANGREPWRQGENPKPGNAEPHTGTSNPDSVTENREPGTKNPEPGTENL
jgi:four helix bundle protein